jgi:hypothetical protein
MCLCDERGLAELIGLHADADNTDRPGVGCYLWCVLDLKRLVPMCLVLIPFLHMLCFGWSDDPNFDV